MVKLGSIDTMQKRFYVSFFRLFLSNVYCHGCPISFVFFGISVSLFTVLSNFLCIPTVSTRYTRTNEGTFIRAFNARLTNDIAPFWTIVIWHSLISWVYGNLIAAIRIHKHQTL